MALAGLVGRDSNCYGWDVTQFKTEEEKAVLEQEVKRFRLNPDSFYDDGLIFFAPEMNLFPMKYPDDSIMKKKFFFVHMPWEDSKWGMNWTPFYEKVKTELNWRCFKVIAPRPYALPLVRYIFYKYGMMPDEPNRRDIPASFHKFDKDAVVQGNITYRNRTLWETVNRELAFNDNTKPFEEAFASYNIDIW